MHIFEQSQLFVHTAVPTFVGRLLPDNRQGSPSNGDADNQQLMTTIESERVSSPSSWRATGSYH